MNGVILSQQNWLSRKVVYMDLCAGNGQLDEYGQTCSPLILFEHAKWARENGLQAELVLREINSDAFESLSRVVDASLPWIDMALGDGGDYKRDHDKTENRFVHLDPNSPADMPDPNGWGDLWNERTFMVMTLGCNGSGVKRLPLIKRRPWFTYVETVLHRLPRRYEALFVSLDNDQHQWTYMLVFPEAWSKRISKSLPGWANKTLPENLRKISVHSWRRNQNDFIDAVRRRFLTHQEYEDNAA